MSPPLFKASLLAVVFTCGCTPLQPSEDLPANPLSEVRSNLTFSCIHEQIPDSPANVDELFQYARWLQKGNLLKQDPLVYAQVERLYRIATEHQHYKANINLQNGGRRGHFKVRGVEHLRLSQALIDAGVATGYYFVSIFLKSGSAGLEANQDLSLRYLRKAADTGSDQAQYKVANILAPVAMAPEISTQMLQCAAEQGHGEAARMLGVHFKHRKQYSMALEAFQLGVKAGDSTSASYLEEGFNDPTDPLDYLNQEKDRVRAERYEHIWSILADYSHANPKVPEIDEILPLPPAPLPEWDGKLQWLEARLANVPPPKPTEGLIHALAKEKGLDPATGKPMPGSPAFSQASRLLPPMVRSG